MAHRAHRPHNFRAISKPKKIQKQDHKHYWPYIPVLLLIVATFFVSMVQPMQRRGVLAYATNMSTSGLLQSTNQHRSNNSIATLQLNNTLSAAAQAKANDMVARNYWSHNTPNGDEPWVFIKNAGYNYTRAGENLAYGFATSSDTVTGWMNSQTHRDNMLDATFTEVGFGFSNSENFNNSGPETVVVAMYAKPQVLASGNNVPAPAPAPTPAKKAPAPTAVTKQPTRQPEEEKTQPVATTTDTPILSEPATIPIARVGAMTNGQAPWAVFAIGALTGIALALLLLKHAVAVRHVIRDSEKFILRHPLLDTVLVSIVLVGVLLSQTTGFIK